MHCIVMVMNNSILKMCLTNGMILPLSFIRTPIIALLYSFSNNFVSRIQHIIHVCIKKQATELERL